MGYEDGGQLTERVRRKSWSVLLFDEIEKAHEDVWGILLQIMEDGRLTDSLGRRVDFGNTLIIMTSNIGAKAIGQGRSAIGFGGYTGKAAVDEQVMEELKATFKPEFLNRLDETIIFRQLTVQDMTEITKTLLSQVKERFEGLGIGLFVPDETVEYLAGAGHDEKYGARPLRRTIRRLIEDSAAQLILEGKASSGDCIWAELEKGGIVLKIKQNRV